MSFGQCPGQWMNMDLHPDPRDWQGEDSQGYREEHRRYHYKELGIRKASDFSIATLGATRKWSKAFHILGKNDPHLEIWFCLEYQSSLRVDVSFIHAETPLVLFSGDCWRTPPEQGFKPRKQMTQHPGKGGCSLERGGEDPRVRGAEASMPQGWESPSLDWRSQRLWETSLT